MPATQRVLPYMSFQKWTCMSADEQTKFLDDNDLEFMGYTFTGQNSNPSQVEFTRKHFDGKKTAVIVIDALKEQGFSIIEIKEILTAGLDHAEEQVVDTV